MNELGAEITVHRSGVVAATEHVTSGISMYLDSL